MFARELSEKQFGHRRGNEFFGIEPRQLMGTQNLTQRLRIKYPQPSQLCLLISKEVEEFGDMRETGVLTGHTEPASSFLPEDQWRQTISERQPKHGLDDPHAPIGVESISCRDAPCNLLDSAVVIGMHHMQAMRLPDGCFQHQILWRKSGLFIRLLEPNTRRPLTEKGRSLSMILRSREEAVLIDQGMGSLETAHKIRQQPIG